MSNGTITMTGAEYDALAGKIAALEAELARMRAGQEPVAYQCREIGEGDWADCDKKWFDCCERSPLHDTRKLYTTPQPSAVPDDHTEQALAMVPVKPTQAMISAGWKVGLMGMDRDGPQAIYDAMLAAAPSAQVTVQGDADNYRWLRDQHNNVNSDIGVYDGANILATQEGELDLDAAIAAARKGEV